VNEQSDPGQYYRDHVIGGVVTDSDYDDFARAIRLKLIEEIQSKPTATKHGDRRLSEG
jgi:hypothetical protein